MKDTRRPSLSLCMIVRNEARWLAGCLQSARDAVDEVLVVDTGSTDGTASLASRLGARVASFAWTDDFAAARNASLAQARGEWILVLDADERLPETAGPRLRALLDGPADVVAYLLQQRSPTPSSAATGMVRTEWLPRLFRNGVGARYAGRVHECVLPSLAGKGRVLHADLVIQHDGYLRAPEAVRAKALRNLRILLGELARNPADPLAWIQTGDCRACLQQTDGAIAAYRAGLDLLEGPGARSRPPVDPATAAAAWQQLAAALLIRGQAAEAVPALERALRLWPALAPARMLLGQARARLGDWAGAVEEYRQAIALAEGPAPPGQPVHLDPWLAWQLKGAAEARLGRDAEAEGSLAEALRLNPASAEARRLLALLRQLRAAAPAAAGGGG